MLIFHKIKTLRKTSLFIIIFCTMCTIRGSYQFPCALKAAHTKYFSYAKGVGRHSLMLDCFPHPIHRINMPPALLAQLNNFLCLQILSAKALFVQRNRFVECVFVGPFFLKNDCRNFTHPVYRKTININEIHTNN